MNLGNRLETVYSYLKPNTQLADIGCDHGYLCIKYAKNNKDTIIYAVDNKKGPLEACLKNIKEKGLENQIIPVLSDGLTNLSDDVKQISICGMGGSNMISIFQTSYDKFQNLDFLVLEPNCGSYELRKYLTNNNFKIIDEKLVEENSIVYEIICLEKGNQKLNEKELIFGPIILKNKNELFVKKYRDYQNFLEKIISKIPVKEENIEKINSLKKELDLVKGELDEI